METTATIHEFTTGEKDKIFLRLSETDAPSVEIKVGARTESPESYSRQALLNDLLNGVQPPSDPTHAAAWVSELVSVIDKFDAAISTLRKAVVRGNSENANTAEINSLVGLLL